MSKQSSTDEVSFSSSFLLWLYLRNINSFNQSTKLQYRQKTQQTVSRAIETYLLTINSKVTEYQTIQKYLYHLVRLAEQANMPFVNITLDVGTAINAYLVTWNDPTRFDKVFIHLESFHFVKENF